MKDILSDRMHDVPRSFIREILKVSINPDIISFAGGLPNRKFFPVKQLQTASNRVFDEQGTDCLQYSNSEGLVGLREYIVEQYLKEQNIILHPDNILITNGSQQALDLIAKVTLNEGDEVIIEEPGYLGAIQALSLYQPKYLPVQVFDHGMDINQLSHQIEHSRPKLMYTVPNFQNPSGISYTIGNRREIVEIVSGKPILLIEDDPYGALRFRGDRLPSFHHYLPEQTLLLGSFSKVVVPGFRLGWVAAPDKIIEKLIIAKQASDLHTSNFTQYILLRFLLDNDLNEHVRKISEVYGKQCQAMLDAIDTVFPKEVACTRPEGGMFLWGRLPDGMSSMALFDQAVKQEVVFVPGDPFYTGTGQTSTFRLNFSCVDEVPIRKGISRLARAITTMLEQC